MKSLISNEQKSINGLWEKPLYIPIYQREFVWDDEQIQNSVRTIFDDKDSNIESYMGNILLVEKDKYFEIVDGQQRMTFTFIFIKSIYELMSEIKEKVEKNEENIDFLSDIIQSTLDKAKKLLIVDNEHRFVKKHIPRIFYASDKLNKHITSLLYGIVDGIKKNTDKRISIFKMQIKLKSLIMTTITDKDNISMKDYEIPSSSIELKKTARKLKSLFDYITENVKYIKIKLNDEKYATEIFERMNSTSKPLTDYELFKNYIAGKLIDKEIIDVESKIIELDDLVNDEKYKLDTKSIIRALLYLKHGKVTNSKYKFEKLKGSYSSLNNPEEMYNEVKKLIETYSNLEKLSLDKGEEKILLPYLIIKTYNLKQLRPALIAMVLTHGYSDDVVELFMLLISIIFKKIIFNGEVANVIESLLFKTFATEDNRLNMPRKIIEEIKSKPWYSETKSLNIEQKTFNSIKNNEFIKTLWIYSVNEEFGGVKSLTNSSSVELKINFDKIQIEHILPKSWEKNWSDVVGKFEELERAELIENPGNKIPILGEYNNKASNKSFTDKKENHYIKSSFNQLILKDKNKWVISTGLHFDLIEESEIWNKEKIEERSKKLRKDFLRRLNEFL